MKTKEYYQKSYPAIVWSKEELMDKIFDLCAEKRRLEEKLRRKNIEDVHKLQEQLKNITEAAQKLQAENEVLRKRCQKLEERYVLDHLGHI